MMAAEHAIGTYYMQSKPWFRGLIDLHRSTDGSAGLDDALHRSVS
jgi:hypothetical protein